ncbi:MAG: DUF4124 domain-containing protein [Betaproteobacteria bacterium HGW-Betaproteobacteria-22]|nr:MAG: DUF4124 domain-containing protein [Betaproteobacteria bacterium HGW-Betaproteobacteria-22]
MIVRLLLVCFALSPLLANAEIYKWKDKDGSVRYSDVPPPSNIKYEPMSGKKLPKPTGQPPLAPVEGDVTSALNRAKAADKAQEEKAPITKEEAAKKRAQDAEVQKKIDEQKQAELKLKQENCRVAKSNLITFTNGGRISQVNDKGEREFLGDAEIARGKADAERDVAKYCD